MPKSKNNDPNATIRIIRNATSHQLEDPNATARQQNRNFSTTGNNPPNKSSESSSSSQTSPLIGANSDIILKKPSDQLEIPIPAAEARASARQRKRWNLPEFYIKYAANTCSKLPTGADFYDLSRDDLMWIEGLLRNNESLKFTGSQVSKLIEYFEHFSFLAERNLYERTGVTLSLEEARKLGFFFGIKKEIVSLVHEHWLKTRKQSGFSLIRRYRKQPPQDDPSPLVSFRPRYISRRTSTRYSSRNYKNDKTLLHKIKVLKGDFKHLSHILSLVRQREEKKREQMIFDSLIFDKKLIFSEFGQMVKSLSLNNQISKPIANLYLNSSLPYSKYFKFNDRITKTKSFGDTVEGSLVDFYSQKLESKTQNPSKKFMLYEKEIIPEGYSKSVVFRIDAQGNLTFDFFYNSSEKKTFEETSFSCQN